jgi:hypothetical protein
VIVAVAEANQSPGGMAPGLFYAPDHPPMSQLGHKRNWLGLNAMSVLPSDADIASAAGHVG